MQKYKHLKGVGHNWADSFLSVENYNQKGYFSYFLYQSACESNSEKIVINLLNGDVSPKEANTEHVREFTKNIPWEFSKFLLMHSCNPNMVSSARLEIVYQFDTSKMTLPDISQSYYFSGKLKAPGQYVYTSTVYIYDDRGKEHSIKVSEWWR